MGKHGEARFPGRVTTIPGLEVAGQFRCDMIFIDAELPFMIPFKVVPANRQYTAYVVAILNSGKEKEYRSIARDVVRRSAQTVIQNYSI